MKDYFQGERCQHQEKNSRDQENYIYQKWEIPSGTGGAERPDTIPY